MSDRETTTMLMERLQRHYIKPGPMPGGVFVPECGLNGVTGSRVDALYVGFTSASGRMLVGHEVKASRADWHRELDKVGKADRWADNCHEWWIVAPGPEVVPKEEIPNGWGLMYPSARSKTRMDKIVRATTHADRTPSWQITRSVLARLDTLRANHDAEVQRKALESAREEHRRLQEQVDRRASQATMSPEDRSRLGALERIEQALGVSIDQWAYGDSGKVDADTAAAALRLVALVDQSKIDSASYAADALRRTVKNMADMLDDYEAARASLLALAGKKDR